MADKKVVRHDLKCEECGKPATRNVQNQWHEYAISRNGNFKETNNWEGDENYFLCDDCEL